MITRGIGEAAAELGPVVRSDLAGGIRPAQLARRQLFPPGLDSFDRFALRRRVGAQVLRVVEADLQVEEHPIRQDARPLQLGEVHPADLVFRRLWRDLGADVPLRVELLAPGVVADQGVARVERVVELGANVAQAGLRLDSRKPDDGAVEVVLASADVEPRLSPRDGAADVGVHVVHLRDVVALPDATARRTEAVPIHAAVLTQGRGHVVAPHVVVLVVGNEAAVEVVRARLDGEVQ